MNQSDKKLYTWLVWGQISRHWPRFVAASFCTGLIVVANLVEPQLIRYVIDHLLPDSTPRMWVAIFACWAGLFLLQHIVLFLQLYFQRQIADKSASEVRRTIFDRMLGLSQTYYENNDRAELTIAMTQDVDDLEPLWGKIPLAMLWHIATVIGSLGFALFISTRLTIYLLVSVASVTLFAHWVDRMLLVSATLLRETSGHIASLTTRSIYQSKLVQLYLAHAQLNDQMKIHTTRLENQGLGITKWYWLNQTIGDFLGFITLVGVLGIGGYMVSNNEISLGSLVSFILYIDMLGVAFIRLRSQMAEATKGKVAARKLVNILGEPSRIPKSADSQKSINKVESIRLHNLGFSYGSDEYLFEGLSLGFVPGILHIIRGKNGTGKSTLLDIIIGYTRPTEGSVIVNSTDLKAEDACTYWRRCSALLQEDLIYNDTVEFNLRLGNPHVSSYELATILVTYRLATDLSDAICMLSRQAEQLSTGQKRRLAIVRIVLRQSDVYLFDEPTANLDEESCKEIITLILSLSLNSIVIVTTQELELFGLGCHTYVLDNRRLVKQRPQ